MRCMRRGGPAGICIGAPREALIWGRPPPDTPIFPTFLVPFGNHQNLALLTGKAPGYPRGAHKQFNKFSVFGQAVRF